MPSDPPFHLGPFAVDREGRLTPRAPGDPPAFHFRWRGRSMHARLHRQGDGSGQLILQTRLGRVPSTASDPDATRRAQTFGVLGSLRQAVPPDWHIRLSADHGVAMQVDGPMPVPFTATALLTRITTLILTLAPYLALLDEMQVPGFSAGPDTVC